MSSSLETYRIRQRHQLVQDKLHAIGWHLPFLCDEMFERGEFSEQQWTDLHLFRWDQVQLRHAQVKSQVRGPRPKGGGDDAKAGLFRMPNSALARAERCRDAMDGHCYNVAMVLVGLKDGQVERLEAVNAAWQVAQLYRGNGGRERWRDSG